MLLRGERDRRGRAIRRAIERGMWGGSLGKEGEKENLVEKFSRATGYGWGHAEIISDIINSSAVGAEISGNGNRDETL